MRRERAHECIDAAFGHRGWDVAATYRTTLPWGDLQIETQHTFQEEDVRAVFTETAEDLNGLVGDPDWVKRLNLTLDRGPWSYFWGISFIGSSDNYENIGGNMALYRGETFRVVLDTETVVYHAASVSRDFEDQGLKFRVGVSNVLNEEPPQLSTIGAVGTKVNTIGNSAFYSQCDWIGRRFILNLTKTFKTIFSPVDWTYRRAACGRHVPVRLILRLAGCSEPGSILRPLAGPRSVSGSRQLSQSLTISMNSTGTRRRRP